MGWRRRPTVTSASASPRVRLRVTATATPGDRRRAPGGSSGSGGCRGRLGLALLGWRYWAGVTGLALLTAAGGRPGDQALAVLDVRGQLTAGQRVAGIRHGDGGGEHHAVDLAVRRDQRAAGVSRLDIGADRVYVTDDPRSVVDVRAAGGLGAAHAGRHGSES